MPGQRIVSSEKTNIFKEFMKLFEEKPKSSSSSSSVLVSPFKIVTDPKTGEEKQVVGGFEILGGVLGHGGNSVVRMGRKLSPHFGKEQKEKKQGSKKEREGEGEEEKEAEEGVAVKCLNLSSSLSRKIKEKGMDEIGEVKILKRLLHPSIPKLLHLGHSSSFAYLVLEKAPGMELFDYIQREGTLKEDVSRKIFSQILDALLYLHSNSIVHHDLKIENIMVSPSDHSSFLIDFGHSFFLESSQTHKPSSYSTLEYASPELLLFNEASFASDVWALGVCLFVMLEGYLPFDGPESKVRDLISDPSIDFSSPNLKMSDEAKNLISQMLHPSPSKRISLSLIKAHPWYFSSLSHYYNQEQYSLSQ